MKSRYVVPSHILARSVGDDTVLLDLKQDEYFSLDRVGTQVWALLSSGTDTDGIVEEITSSYKIDRDTVFSDVAKLLTELTEAGLVEAQPAD